MSARVTLGASAAQRVSAAAMLVRGRAWAHAVAAVAVAAAPPARPFAMAARPAGIRYAGVVWPALAAPLVVRVVEPMDMGRIQSNMEMPALPCPSQVCLIYCLRNLAVLFGLNRNAAVRTVKV